MYEEADVILRESLRVLTAVGYREFRALCLSVLGRNLARMCRYEEAMDVLSEARSEYVEIRSQDGVLDCDAKTAECYALRGDATSALDLASEALARAGSAEGGAVDSMLERVRGYALGQLGRWARGPWAFEASLSRSHARGGGTAVRRRALARRHHSSRGCPPVIAAPAAFEVERAELLEQLGVVSIAEIPLDDDDRGSDVMRGRLRSRPSWIVLANPSDRRGSSLMAMLGSRV